MDISTGQIIAAGSRARAEELAARADELDPDVRQD